MASWRLASLVKAHDASSVARLAASCDQLQFVFTRARAPHDGLHPSALTSMVHRACRRAGLPQVVAHRLRQTAATEMLRVGSSLREVGQVLRHRSSAIKERALARTTAIGVKPGRHRPADELLAYLEAL